MSRNFDTLGNEVGAFSRKHYDRLAIMIATLPMPIEERYLIASHFALLLSRDYSQFKRRKFMQAATIRGRAD